MIRKIPVLLLIVFACYRVEAQLFKVVRSNPGAQEGIEYPDMIFSPDSKFAYTASSSGLALLDYNSSNGKVKLIEIIKVILAQWGTFQF